MLDIKILASSTCQLVPHTTVRLINALVHDGNNEEKLKTSDWSHQMEWFGYQQWMGQRQAGREREDEKKTSQIFSSFFSLHGICSVEPKWRVKTEKTTHCIQNYNNLHTSRALARYPRAELMMLLLLFRLPDAWCLMLGCSTINCTKCKQFWRAFHFVCGVFFSLHIFVRFVCCHYFQQNLSFIGPLSH